MLVGSFLISLAVFACQVDSSDELSPLETPRGNFSEPTGSKPLSQVIREMEYSGRPITPPRQIPDFRLRDQSDQWFSTSDLAGKTALISFAYTNCPDVCPALFGEFLSIRRLLEGELNSELELVIISVDPERDTPERLSLITSEFGGEWKFLQGSRSELEEVWAKFRISVVKEGDLVGHSGVTYLVTPDGEMTVNFPAFATASHFEQDARPLLEASLARKELISVSDAWIRPNLDPTAVYLTLSNTGNSDVTITGARADWAGHVSLHETLERDGLMMMSPVEVLLIPQGGTVNLVPGGLHIMAKDLSSPISQGQSLPVYLQLEGGGTVEVVAEVRTP